MGTFVDPDSPVQPMTLVETDTYFDPSSVLFDYEPGDDLLGFGGTFTRASTATYVDVNGVVQTAASGVARDGHYIGGVRTLLLEDTRTNVVTFKRDLTNAAWSKTTCTTAKDQTGADGAANAATSLLATAGNALALLPITLASSVRAQSAYVKRLVGTGTIFMTMDNGATWTAVTVTSAWTRVSIPSQTLANPVIGFRILTNGDKIAVDFVQNENGAFPSSVIAITNGADTRAADALSFPFTPAPQAMTMYARVIEQGTITVGGGAGVSFIGLNGGTDPFFALYANGGKYVAVDFSVTSTAAAAPVSGDTVDLRGILYADGSVQLGQSINGATEVVAAQSGVHTMGGAFGAATLTVNATPGLGTGFNAFVRLAISTGNKTLDVFPGKRTLYWCGTEYRTKSTDTPANTLYRGRLSNPGVYTYDLIASWSKGVAQFGIGSIELANTDGQLDSLTKYVFDGYQIRFYSGTLNATGALTRTLLFQGLAEQPDVSLEKVMVPIRSQTYGLDKPILSKRFLGTGGVEGNSSIAGTIKPRVYGSKQNIPLIPVDPANVVYFVADRFQVVTNIYDSGLALTLDGTVLANVAALYAAAAPATGHWIMCGNDTEGTYVRCGITPSGQLTGDAHILTGGGLPTSSGIVGDILHDSNAITTGGLVSLLYGDSLGAGVYVTDDTTTYADVLAIALRYLSAWLWIHPQAYVLQRPPTPDATVALVSISDSDILEMTRLGNPKTPGEGVPPWSVAVDYSENVTVQTDGLAATVTLNRRNFLSRQYRSLSHTDARVLKQYPLAKTVRISSDLQDNTPFIVQSEADGVFGTLNLPRDYYQIRFKVPAVFLQQVSAPTAGAITYWVPATMPGFSSASANPAIGVRTTRFGFTTSGNGTNVIPVAGSLDLAMREMTMIGWTTYRSA